MCFSTCVLVLFSCNTLLTSKTQPITTRPRSIRPMVAHILDGHPDNHWHSSISLEIFLELKDFSITVSELVGVIFRIRGFGILSTPTLNSYLVLFEQ